jgi:diguanylate cyclase (GGDEF)-like protein/PAS domain S-box-containing protein
MEVGKMLTQAVDRVNDFAMILDKSGKCVYQNKKVREFGLCTEDLKNSFSRKIRTIYKKVIRTEKICNEEIEIKWKGKKHYLVCNQVPIVSRNGRLVAVGVFARDITKRIMMIDRLEKDANRDKLTGLYNRNWVETMKKRFRRGNRRRDFPLTVIMADIDGIKKVNDDLGHDHGDKLICDVANMLREIFRENDWVARYGDRGDEFMVFLPGVKLFEGKKILLRIREKHVGLPVSFGLAMSRDGKGIDRAIKKADVEMYKNKRMRKGR